MFLIINIRSNLTHLPHFQLLVLHLLHIEIIFFFIFSKKTNQLALSRQNSKCCKRVIESAKNCYVEKTKESITSQKFGSCNFWCITNSVLKRVKSAIPPLFNGSEVLTFASEKVKLFAEIFSKNSNLDDSGHELPSFSCRTDITLSNMVITPKMVKEVISNVNPSKAMLGKIVFLNLPELRKKI